ncbi:Wadjet anti-phage system protein JetD domain-containing protein, partial [Dehalococcoides sp.]|uniref:Wadjet anti-phage system protein JetD domain-containing protein n=1 Tax=Dehalococcoides sp. TaxID=1966486 RepID=UPI003561847F
ASVPSAVISIENQTTFHEEARARHEENVLLIYTAGMPNSPWRDMYVRILQGLPREVPVFHWGDIDEGGFRIASVLAKEAARAGHTLLPMKMHPQDVPTEHRRPASPKTIERMAYFARQAGWDEISMEIEKAGFTVEQESL